MFALNETAALYAYVGQRGGKPEYAQRGAVFPCRSEIARGRRFSGNAAERGADTRIFAQGVEVGPGDRIRLNGVDYVAVKVEHVRGWRGIHHLEILAREEG